MNSVRSKALGALNRTASANNDSISPLVDDSIMMNDTLTAGNDDGAINGTGINLSSAGKAVGVEGPLGFGGLFSTSLLDTTMGGGFLGPYIQNINSNMTALRRTMMQEVNNLKTEINDSYQNNLPALLRMELQEKQNILDQRRESMMYDLKTNIVKEVHTHIISRFDSDLAIVQQNLQTEIQDKHDALTEKLEGILNEKTSSVSENVRILQERLPSLLTEYQAETQELHAQFAEKTLSEIGMFSQEQTRVLESQQHSMKNIEDYLQTNLSTVQHQNTEIIRKQTTAEEENEFFKKDLFEAIQSVRSSLIDDIGTNTVNTVREEVKSLQTMVQRDIAQPMQQTMTKEMNFFSTKLAELASTLSSVVTDQLQEQGVNADLMTHLSEELASLQANIQAYDERANERATNMRADLSAGLSPVMEGIAELQDGAVASTRLMQHINNVASAVNDKVDGVALMRTELRELPTELESLHKETLSGLAGITGLLTDQDKGVPSLFAGQHRMSEHVDNVRGEIKDTRAELQGLSESLHSSINKALQFANEFKAKEIDNVRSEIRSTVERMQATLSSHVTQSSDELEKKVNGRISGIGNNVMDCVRQQHTQEKKKQASLHSELKKEVVQLQNAQSAHSKRSLDQLAALVERVNGVAVANAGIEQVAQDVREISGMRMPAQTQDIQEALKQNTDLISSVMNKLHSRAQQSQESLDQVSSSVEGVKAGMDSFREGQMKTLHDIVQRSSESVSKQMSELEDVTVSKCQQILAKYDDEQSLKLTQLQNENQELKQKNEQQANLELIGFKQEMKKAMEKASLDISERVQSLVEASDAKHALTTQECFTATTASLHQITNTLASEIHDTSHTSNTSMETKIDAKLSVHSENILALHNQISTEVEKLPDFISSVLMNLRQKVAQGITEVEEVKTELEKLGHNIKHADENYMGEIKAELKGLASMQHNTRDEFNDRFSNLSKQFITDIHSVKELKHVMSENIEQQNQEMETTRTLLREMLKDNFGKLMTRLPVRMETAVEQTQSSIVAHMENFKNFVQTELHELSRDSDQKMRVVQNVADVVHDIHKAVGENHNLNKSNMNHVNQLKATQALADSDFRGELKEALMDLMNKLSINETTIAHIQSSIDNLMEMRGGGSGGRALNDTQASEMASSQQLVLANEKKQKELQMLISDLTQLVRHTLPASLQTMRTSFKESLDHLPEFISHVLSGMSERLISMQSALSDMHEWYDTHGANDEVMEQTVQQMKKDLAAVLSKMQADSVSDVLESLDDFQNSFNTHATHMLGFVKATQEKQKSERESQNQASSISAQQRELLEQQGQRYAQLASGMQESLSSVMINVKELCNTHAATSQEQNETLVGIVEKVNATNASVYSMQRGVESLSIDTKELSDLTMNYTTTHSIERVQMHEDQVMHGMNSIQNKINQQQTLVGELRAYLEDTHSTQQGSLEQLWMEMDQKANQRHAGASEWHLALMNAMNKLPKQMNQIGGQLNETVSDVILPALQTDSSTVKSKVMSLMGLVETLSTKIDLDRRSHIHLSAHHHDGDDLNASTDSINMSCVSHASGSNTNNKALKMSLASDIGAIKKLLAKLSSESKSMQSSICEQNAKLLADAQSDIKSSSSTNHDEVMALLMNIVTNHISHDNGNGGDDKGDSSTTLVGLKALLETQFESIASNHQQVADQIKIVIGQHMMSIRSSELHDLEQTLKQMQETDQVYRDELEDDEGDFRQELKEALTDLMDETKKLTVSFDVDGDNGDGIVPESSEARRGKIYSNITQSLQGAAHDAGSGEPLK